MIAYVDSSIVLAWVLNEPDDAHHVERLFSMEQLVTSELTRAECMRGLYRAHGKGRLSHVELLAGERLVHEALSGWQALAVNRDILTRAAGAFASPFIRTLDAIHLASAIVFRDRLGPLTIASRDHRLRDVAAQLSFPVFPADVGP